MRPARLRGVRPHGGRSRRLLDPRRWRREARVGGRPFPGVEVRLVDEAGGEVEDGTPARSWCAGPTSSPATGPTVRAARGRRLVRHGDVAYLDDDGDLVLVDRRKELVIVNGFNVYPREVEDAIVGHPDIDEVAVLGVPDERTGEAVRPTSYRARLGPRRGRRVGLRRRATGPVQVPDRS